MKIPKLIETMTWVFSMDGRIPKPDPLRFSEISMLETGERTVGSS